MAQYKYRPLNRERDEIRLVRLLPGAFDDEMQIEIFHAQLSSDWSSRSVSLGDDTSDNEDTGSELSECVRSDDEATNHESVNTLSKQSRKPSPSGEERHPRGVLGNDRNVENSPSRHLGNTRARSASSRGRRSDSLAASRGNSDEDSSNYDSLSDDDSTSGYSASLQGELEYDYEALSYVWGSIIKLYTIRVRDSSPRSIPSSDVELHSPNTRDSIGLEFTTLEITQNLLIALRHLRKSLAIRILWVDSICINQNDIEERSAEVRRMGCIYSSAWRVLVWLGPEGDDSTLAITFLKSIAMRVDTGDPDSDSETTSSPRNLALEAEEAQWNAIRRLFDRMWFKRLWVYQEYQVARRCRFIAGRHTLSASRFHKAVTELAAAPLTRVASNSNFLEKGQLERICFFMWKERQSQCQFFRSTRHALCLDPRDRVYAALSLLGSPYQQEIRPDYSLQVEDVYRDLMVCHIRNSEIIILFQLISGYGKFPISWIPDLGNPDLPRYTFPSCLNASGNSRHEIIYSEANSSLCVRGMRIGIISRVGESVPNTASIVDILGICHRWEPPDLLDAKYIEGGSLFDAFLNTILCGFTREIIVDIGWPSLENFRKAYLSYLTERPIDGSTNILHGWLEMFLPGRTFLSTTDGHIGLCLPSAQAGDYIVIALGCKRALVLRPIPESSDQFQLKGECFICGFMQNEAFLGSLSELGCITNPWRTVYAIDDDLAIYTNGIIDTQNDPRLGPLPQNWRIRFGFEANDLYDEEFDADGDRMLLWFENMENGDVTAYDPRLTSEALKARGVNIQDFIIV